MDTVRFGCRVATAVLSIMLPLNIEKRFFVNVPIGNWLLVPNDASEEIK